MFIAILATTISLLSMCADAAPKVVPKIVPKIVIDPGHGGADLGTVYQGGRYRIAEKEVTLKLARVIQHILSDQGFQVSLTRNSDHELSLPARTTFANRIKADLFISIHMNNASHEDSEGIETFILNSTTDASSKRLAHIENSVISAQPPISPQELDVALILKDLRLDGNLSHSKKLACLIQQNLVTTTSVLENRKKRNRGVKQALFHVLLGADMPSVLVETGFLSHPQDRARVLSGSGQRALALSISNAIQGYFGLGANARNAHTLSACKVN